MIISPDSPRSRHQSVGRAPNPPTSQKLLPSPTIMMSNTASSNQPQRRSNRLQSQQTASANTASTTVAEGAAAPRGAVPSQGQKKEKNEKSAFRDGKHPETGLRTRHCCCPNNKKCRERAWLYAAMGNEEMLCYVNIPKYPASPNTEAGRHTINSAIVSLVIY